MVTINNIIDRIKVFYECLRKLPKPQPYKVGGTYYGGTQLFSSVGCHLDLIQGEQYTSYGYGCNIQYEELYGIRLGGAYKTDIQKELVEYLRKNAETIKANGWELINDYGTNFSTIGIAKRR